MPVQTAKQKKILDILNNLPPERIDEVIDFAEYLKKKKAPLQKTRKQCVPLKIPTFHLGQMAKQAFNRGNLYSDYLDRKFD